MFAPVQQSHLTTSPRCPMNTNPAPYAASFGEPPCLQSVVRELRLRVDSPTVVPVNELRSGDLSPEGNPRQRSGEASKVPHATIPEGPGKTNHLSPSR